ncbi:hypothetical protein [Sagittula salina]|uniref:Uncharacterized protein n=1 Tax=Sagittula salina TaxID=2820268 RepID=A0A940MXI5_9RHOB|nr:hypothetical protein [Sagittula salina]MBP0484679.1 hypothetical protein [Sagittula salina]
MAQSGVAGFLQGAFDGYTMGAQIRDAKTRRDREKEDRERRATDYAYTDETRDHARKKRDWDFEDRDYTLSERERKRRDDDATRAYEEDKRARERRNNATDDAETARVREAAAAERQAFADAYAAAEAARPPAPLGRGIIDAGQLPEALPAPRSGRSIFALDPSMSRQATVQAPAAAPAQAPAAPPPAVPQQASATDTTDGPPKSFLDDPKVHEIIAEYPGVTPERVWSRLPPDGREPYLTRETAAPATQDQEPAAPAAPAQTVTTSAGPARGMAAGIPVEPGAFALGQGAETRGQAFGIGEAEKHPASDPSVQAASAGVSVAAQQGILTPGQRATPQQRTQATESFMDTYKRVAVPQIQQFYLQRGEIDKARAFDQWIESDNGKAVQKEFANLAFSLTIGDLNGTLDNIEKMYSSVNDGYDIVREKSAFETYQNGQPSALVITFRDSRGQEFQQRVEDQGDLAAQLLGLVNPQETFNYLLERHDASVNAELERRKSAKSIIKREDVMAEAKRLQDDIIEQNKNTAFGQEEILMPSDDELFARAYENLLRGEALARGGRSAPQASGQGPGGLPMPDFRLTPGG